MTLIEKLRKQADDTSNPIYWELRNLLNEAADALEDQDQLIEDYEEVNKDKKRLVRELDVLLNGEAGAAKQASLCDIVCQVSSWKRSAGYSDIVSDGGMDPRTEYERLCNEYVYESPDGGKTIYRRRFGGSSREQVK